MLRRLYSAIGIVSTAAICGVWIVSAAPDYWLKVAARTNAALAIEPLIYLGARPNSPAIDGQALWIAALMGNSATVRALLDAGADVHAADDFALAEAAKYGRTEIVQILLERGANIHAEDDLALRVASSAGQIETVRLLLQAGASPHAADNDALRWARIGGHRGIIQLLEDSSRKRANDG
ncbi:ankyrin repeat domain-containing protein [Bradyrhizobium sp. SZCCHNRI3043]|uniref:ankyrin repeat domain-containing protein n=1 Tax=Bradyrhizobium sp. SZCCHNRI3043 TaxID=3057292 RepID=UPI0039657FC6